MNVNVNERHYLLSERGTEIMTPLPVPIHRRLEEMSSAVIRTKENPNLPVPATT
jgi:hypothetical protein